MPNGTSSQVTHFDQLCARNEVIINVVRLFYTLQRVIYVTCRPRAQVKAYLKCQNNLRLVLKKL